MMVGTAGNNHTGNEAESGTGPTEGGHQLGTNHTSNEAERGHQSEQLGPNYTGNEGG